MKNSPEKFNEKEKLEPTEEQLQLEMQNKFLEWIRMSPKDWAKLDNKEKDKIFAEKTGIMDDRELTDEQGEELKKIRDQKINKFKKQFPELISLSQCCPSLSCDVSRLVNGEKFLKDGKPVIFLSMSGKKRRDLALYEDKLSKVFQPGDQITFDEIYHPEK